MDKAKSENISFEAALAELDTVLNALEKGDIPLEDALAHYQRGMALAAVCQQKLATVEEKIEVLQADGSLSAVDSAEGGRYE